MNKIVLLIVPEFPPNDSIGGRRWAKFAKYLAKNDIRVKVIAFQPQNELRDKNWMRDISHSNIEVFYVPSSYPALLQSNSKNIIVRVFKKLLNKIISIYDGGIIQDKAIFFQKQLTKTASELIEKYSIKNIICSGPYHRASYYTVLLKKKFDNLNIIIDFRDRWTDGEVYGLESVSKKAYEKEEALQKYTCENADYVISTYDEILKELKYSYKNLSSEKFRVFSHNYDIDDYVEIDGNPKDRSERIKLIYGGTINTAAFNDGFKPFLYALQKLKELDASVYNLVDVIIYGENYLLNELVTSLKIDDSVKIYPKISEKLFYYEVSQSNFLLSFLGNKWKDLITTKNITYLPFKKPIIIVSKEGLVSKMITENKLGYRLDPDNCYDNLANLLRNYMSHSVIYNASFDYSEFSYERATEKLIKLFKF